MKNLIAILIMLFTVSIATAKDWADYPKVTPADGDKVLTQDASNSNASAHQTLKDLYDYYFFKTGNEIDVDILGYSPNSILYADPSGQVEPHPTVDMLELTTLDGATGNLENRIDTLEAGAGTTSLTVTAGGESSNEIAVTIAATPAANYLSEVWLSATDGGTKTTAFDTWTLSDATAHETITSNVAYRVLTGTDGDAVVTLGEDAEATKYLCAEVAGKTVCAECAFSTEASVCTASTYHTLAVSGNFTDDYKTDHYLAQKLKDTETGTICKATLKLAKIDGDNGVYHLELWTTGTTTNDGAAMGATSSQIGGDSDSVTITTDTTAETVTFVWTTYTKPAWSTGHTFLHLVKESGPDVYWYADGNEMLYPSGDAAGSTYDLWYNGSDTSTDGVFTVYFE